MTLQTPQQGPKCVACGAISPEGALPHMDWEKCPSCGLQALATDAPAEPAAPAWRCDCGNGLMYVTPDGVFCPRCGTYQAGVEVVF